MTVYTPTCIYLYIYIIFPPKIIKLIPVSLRAMEIRKYNVFVSVSNLCISPLYVKIWKMEISVAHI